MISELQDPRILSERLHLALAAARLGSWELKLPERSLEASAQCLANHGVPPDARLDLSGVVEAIETEDRHRFLDAVDGAIAGLGSFEIELPNRWPDGTRHWLLICGRMIDARCMVGVTQDVTERRRLEEQLRDADRRKDEFLATLGHELRNPLASIVTAIRILKTQGPSDPLLVRARNAIERQALQLARLVDDLLDVGRINEGKLRLEKKRAELNALLSQAVESTAPLIEKRGHRLEVVLTQSPVVVEVDPARIVQVLSNLL